MKISGRKSRVIVAISLLTLLPLGAAQAGVPLVETKGRYQSDSSGWYPSTGDLPVISDRFGNGDAFSYPARYARGEFADMAFVNLMPPPIQRARWFALNRMILVPRQGGSAEMITRWEIEAKRSAPTGFFIEWPIIRRPEAITFKIRNDSDQAALLRPTLSEIGTARKWPGARWRFANDIALQPGEEREIRLSPSDVTSLTPETLEARGYNQLLFPAKFGFDLLGMSSGQSRRLEFSDYAVIYGYAAHGTTTALDLPAVATAGEEIGISVSATNVRPDEVLDLELRRADRTRWRIRLDDAQKAQLAGAGQLRIRATVPTYLATGTYALGLVADGYRMTGDEASLTLNNPTRAELPHVEIREEKGRNAIFVNDRLQPWIGHASINLQPADVSTFAQAGADFIVETSVGAGTTMTDEPVWNGRGEPDYGSLDERVAMVLAQRPDARLIIRPNLAMPPLWTQQNPAALARVRAADGTEAAQEVHGLPLSSFSSETWRAAQEDLLRQLVRHIKAQPWAENVIGFWICARPHEWFFGGTTTEFEDYSEDTRDAFASWLRQQPVPGIALAQGSHPPRLPEIAERKGDGQDLHPDTDAGRLTAAYNTFDDHLTAKVITRFAQAIKDETEGRSLVGCHYGYLFVLPDTVNQGRSRTISSFTEVIDSPAIDFVAGVIVPKHWGLDSHDLYSLAFEALRVRGKHYMLSNDHTFFLTPGVGKPWGDPPFDPADPVRGDRYMQQRIIANAAIHGVSPHWFGLRPTWWADEASTRTIAEMTAVYHRTFDLDVTSLDEVALVIDHRGYPWLQDHARFLRTNAYLLYRTLQRTGAPVGTWLLTDIDQLPARIKTVVIGFADAPTTADLEKLRRLIAQGGRTIVVVGRPGLINGETGSWNPDTPAALLGLPVRLGEDTDLFALVPGTAPKKIADQGTEPGYESDNPWVGLGLPKGAFLSDQALSPIPRMITDGASASFRFENGEGASAERPLASGGRLLWLSVPPLNSAIWRHWLGEAGVHFYAPLNYFVHAGRELVSVTAPANENITVTFPAPVRVTDLFEPEVSATGQNIPVKFDRGQTRLFRLEQFK